MSHFCRASGLLVGYWRSLVSHNGSRLYDRSLSFNFYFGVLIVVCLIQICSLGRKFVILFRSDSWIAMSGDGSPAAKELGWASIYHAAFEVTILILFFYFRERNFTLFYLVSFWMGRGLAASSSCQCIICCSAWGVELGSSWLKEYLFDTWWRWLRFFHCCCLLRAKTKTWGVPTRTSWIFITLKRHLWFIKIEYVLLLIRTSDQLIVDLPALLILISLFKRFISLSLFS